nr:uncharacterized protein LOC123775359 [Procambarus clarkii]XP_045626454.1 uncharacterized protein LOC123775359 [Procambarus clarkii]XP_045626455.1 uncharacterized protein LOC123775359 [Procambarus clarkii]XP_045626456.1 uncharacterized protein LOC123775359 [Procambarus clarkii]XP_045626457.1 uncharacterized protein LOC123775359 [Procambarus clarkii]XP_045626458.1 uncharacterized protein LOC123775359 [Procambarus clarkii]XP_045626459.1 uncharacterized protein LOC123775359 [Procambarus clarki
MVLTRLSHFGEVCPLSDHSYSDPAALPNPAHHAPNSKRFPVNVGIKSSHSTSPSALQAASSAATLTSPSFSPSTSSLSLPSTSVTASQALLPSASTSVSSTDSQKNEAIRIHILDLPNEIFENIFAYLTFKKIGEIRRACKRFEQIGSTILNASFQRLQIKMLQRFQSIKGQMPRRESARRKHPLARESDIVETLHMRLTLLQMSFGKHIERKHCCFFAGDILDEVHRILTYIKTTPNLGRAYKVTDELFDLSTMAMEYFKEHIEPCLPEITYFGSDFMDIATPFSEGCSVRSPSGSGRVSEPEDELPERDPLPPSNMVLRKRIRRIRQGMRKYNTQLVALKRELKGCKGKLADQHKQMIEYAARMDEYDKKFEESSRKFSTVLQELNKCKTELQYWRSKSPAHPLLCYSCGQSVGEGSGQQLQAGVLMQGGDEAVVYVPLATASIPESVEKCSPPGVILARDEARERWHAVGGSVRNLERVFDLDIPIHARSVVAHHKSKTPSSQSQSLLPGLYSSQTTVASQSVDESQGGTASPLASSHSSSVSNQVYVAQHSLGTHSQISTSQPVTVPCVLSTPCARTTSVALSAATTITKPQPVIASQPYSAFQACTASQDTRHKWDDGQECAEDLSMSRSYKHYLDEDTDSSFLKRRSSDEDSDNCDVCDDTVGRRVKERKRIKLDIL